MPPRRWMAAAVAAGLLLLASGGVVAGTAWAWGSGSGNLLQAIPADMDLVLRLQPAEGLRSLGLEEEFARQLHSQLRGIDPAEDLDEVVIAMGLGDDPSQPRTLILLRGSFDFERLATELENDGGVQLSEQRHAGQIYFEIEPSPLPEPLAAAPVRRDLVLLGDRTTVRRSLECLAGERPTIEDDSRMAALLAATGSRDLLWCVARTPAALRDSLPPSLQELEAVSLRIGADDTRYVVEASGAFASPVDAVEAYNELEPYMGELDGLVSQGLPGGVEVEMDGLLLEHEVERAGSRVQIELAVSRTVSQKVASDGLGAVR